MADEIRRDPVTGDTVIVKRGGGGSTLLIVVLLLIALAALAYFTGLVNFNPGQAPKMVGGEAPSITTGKIVTGTKKELVDVPVVGMQKAPPATDQK